MAKKDAKIQTFGVCLDSGEEIKREIKIDVSELDMDKITDKRKANFFSEETRVPDVWRYSLKIETENDKRVFSLENAQGKEEDRIKKTQCKRDKEFVDFEIKKKQEQQTIVLLLESPHSKEYCYCDGKFEPIVPANGDTGDNIAQSIIQVLTCIECLSGIKFNDKEKIIICNPVQWQTSMHYFYKVKNNPLNEDEEEERDALKKSLRNKVWRGLWEIQEIQNDFKSRLKKYNPKLVINACTGGTKSYELKYKVNKFLTEQFSNIPKISTNHPSSISWKGNPYGIK